MRGKPSLFECRATAVAILPLWCLRLASDYGRTRLCEWTDCRTSFATMCGVVVSEFIKPREADVEALRGPGRIRFFYHRSGKGANVCTMAASSF